MSKAAGLKAMARNALAGLGLSLALTGPALAQSLEAAPTPELPRVLPVWNTSSGRVEALLLVDRPGAERSAPGPGFSSSSLESLFSARPGLGLQAEHALGHGFSVGADFGLEQAPAMGLLCDGSVGLAAALGRLSEQCLLARLDVDTGAPDLLQQTFGLSGQWSSEDRGLDLSFGLAWLDAESTGNAGNLFSPGLAGLGLLESPALGSLQLQGQELALQGNRWLGPRSWLRVEGRHGRARLGGPAADTASLFGLPREWDSTSLTLSGGYRAFSGNITGRLIEVTEPRTHWTDVDVSVSWRTPWDAKLSVGAKNLLGGPERDEWPASTLPGLPETEARTPYVRYHQDL